MGSDIDTNLPRPAMRVPDAEQVFGVILNDCGYQSETSDKGRYETEIVRKFGDLEKAGYALRSRERTVLKRFLDKSKSASGEGVYLNDDRRYLDFASINQIIDGDEICRNLIDEYVEKGILYRGYIFQCQNCSDVAWHSISDVDQSFTCSRCGLNQQYKFRSWKMPNEPSWFYKLDEMIYLALLNNGDVPLLTLNHLRRRQSKQSFLYRPEIRLKPRGSSKTYLEVDVCCIANGRLCIGEAKSTDDLGNDLSPLQTAERYRDLSLKMGASSVIFSTSQPAWKQASLDAIQEAFTLYPYVEIEILTAAELFG